MGGRGRKAMPWPTSAPESSCWDLLWDIRGVTLMLSFLLLLSWIITDKYGDAMPSTKILQLVICPLYTFMRPTESTESFDSMLRSLENQARLRVLLRPSLMQLT